MIRSQSRIKNLHIKKNKTDNTKGMLHFELCFQIIWIKTLVSSGYSRYVNMLENSKDLCSIFYS